MGEFVCARAHAKINYEFLCEGMDFDYTVMGTILRCNTIGLCKRYQRRIIFDHNISQKSQFSIFLYFYGLWAMTIESKCRAKLFAATKTHRKKCRFLLPQRCARCVPFEKGEIRFSLDAFVAYDYTTARTKWKYTRPFISFLFFPSHRSPHFAFCGYDFSIHTGCWVVPFFRSVVAQSDWLSRADTRAVTTTYSSV